MHPGKQRYLLSWRWDCEESNQVFQNCADILIVDNTWTDEQIESWNRNVTEASRTGAEPVFLLRHAFSA